MKYAYQRQGGPILSWNRAAPQQSRAADSKALGSLGGDSLGAMMLLPLPGSPEPITGMGGCSSCGMGDIVEAAHSTSSSERSAKIGAVLHENRYLIGAGLLGLIAYKHLKKKRR